MTLTASFVFPGGLGRELFFVRESEANAGHFSSRRQTNMRKLRLNCREKGKFETLKGCGGLKSHLQAW